ncbi:MAG: hypothetical protein NPIRA02_01250 [Nitrospirales bacterium]|nr:MAG: hypothetical protein NPIRA02_01250 [Nitrospirales bacterium]
MGWAPLDQVHDFAFRDLIAIDIALGGGEIGVTGKLLDIAKTATSL